MQYRMSVNVSCDVEFVLEYIKQARTISMVDCPPQDRVGHHGETSSVQDPSFDHFKFVT